MVKAVGARCSDYLLNHIVALEEFESALSRR